MSSPREVELKFEVDQTGTGALVRRVRSIFALDPAPSRTLVSTYFDTRKLGLRRRGLSLRVRQDGERRLQTLKADGAHGAGLFSRQEWECELPGEAPDPDLFDDPSAADHLRRRGALAPVFETRIERRSWTVAQGGSEVELSVDEGSVSAGGLSRPIAEIELELKRGLPADLFEMAGRLAAQAPVRIGVRTKSERGYAVLAQEQPTSFKAEAVPLTREMSAGAAFQAIARSCLRQFRLNEELLVERRTEEALHQARVAMRRLRSALSLFGRVVSDTELEGLKRELRGVSGLLGEARNLDVYRARVVAAEKERDPAEPGLADFAARIEGERERAYDAVLARLRSKRFRSFTVALSGWIETGPWLSREQDFGRDEGAWGFACAVLEKRRRRVAKRGRRLDRLTPEARHQVRIEAKKLRYASEFFAALVSGRKAKARHKAFVDALERLQGCLGDLNDIETGHELAESFAKTLGEPIAGDGPQLFLFAAGHAAGDGDSRAADLVASAVEAHAAFADAKSFWR